MYIFKSLSSRAGKACFEHRMLADGDKILVCFSGGKDSYALLRILKDIQKRYPINFELKVLCINPGFDKHFNANLEKFFEFEVIDYEILDTKIKEVLEKQTMIKNFRPCFLCSRLRRGIIYDYAIKNGYNKIALGHNLDDAIQTHLMNLFYGSKTSFLKPSYTADNGLVEVIRPMIYIDEDLIVKFIKKAGFEPLKNKCPLHEENSKREFFRKFVNDMKNENPKIKENAYHAFKNLKELKGW